MSVPNALVAVAALVIACFAITGYIAFRTGVNISGSLSAGTLSVPGKITTGNVEMLTNTKILSPAVSGTLNATTDFKIGTQPANTAIWCLTVIPTEDIEVGDSTTIQFSLGITEGGKEIISDVPLFGNTTFGAVDAGGVKIKNGQPVIVITNGSLVDLKPFFDGVGGRTLNWASKGAGSFSAEERPLFLQLKPAAIVVGVGDNLTSGNGAKYKVFLEFKRYL